MMGGRVAEELVFGREKVTSGAASDIEQATRLARMMVTRWGLSEELGTVSYGENQDEVFLGMSVSRTQNASEATVQKIDSEIKRLVEEGYHEGGHAIVGLNVVATDPIHKATIIPRGRALGMVMQLPERDKLSMSLEQMT